MTLDDIPLFSMLKGRLTYLNQRQQLIGQNVANPDTPGYMPHDLKAFTVEKGPAGILVIHQLAGFRPRPIVQTSP